MKTVLRLYLKQDAKPVNLPKSMIVAYSSNVPTCMVYAKDDKLPILEEKGSTST